MGEGGGLLMYYYVDCSIDVYEYSGVYVEIWNRSIYICKETIAGLVLCSLVYCWSARGRNPRVT